MTTAEPVSMEPTPRCCAVHPSISVLAAHLIADFPQLAANHVLSVVIDAHRACDSIGIPYFEVLGFVEAMARHSLTEHLGLPAPLAVAHHGESGPDD